MGLEEEAQDAIDRLKKHYPEFPDKCCKKAANVLCINSGYPIAAGKVTVTQYMGKDLVHERLHFWNFDEESGLFLDITGSQYNGILPRNLILPDIHIWRPGDPSMEGIYHEVPELFAFFEQDIKGVIAYALEDR